MVVVDPTQVWIYHERQEALLCGQHALNNLAQQCVFTPGQLSEIAHQLDQMELDVWAQNNEGGVNSKDYLQRLREGSNNVDAQGNFSIEVLKAALQHEFGITLPHLSQQDLLSGKDITDMQGFLCHKSDHWFAIRLIGGRFWNLNSMLERPGIVSHFELATEMEKWANQGYTIFCVPSGLPEGGIEISSQGTTENWHKMSDLLQGRSTEKDPWQNVGSGMRLDGVSTMPSSVAVTSTEGLTEDEQIQMALQASLEPAPATKTNGNAAPEQALPPVPPEPTQGDKDAVRIQFRLPSGERKVRRFLTQDKVSVVYAYVQQEAGRPVELKAGFPPKDLVSAFDQTIAEAKLAGESIQGRYK